MEFNIIYPMINHSDIRWKWRVINVSLNSLFNWIKNQTLATWNCQRDNIMRQKKISFLEDIIEWHLSHTLDKVLKIFEFIQFQLYSNWTCLYWEGLYPAGIYLFKVHKNTRTRCETCSKMTIKTPERRHWSRSGVFIVNFEHISLLVLVFLLLTLRR